MPVATLTDITVRALKADQRTDYWCARTPSFGVRVGGRTKTFIVKRANRRITIGRYPQWSLAEAREKAKQLLIEKSAPNRINVFHAIDVFEREYLQLRNRASTAKETARVLRKGLAPLALTRMDTVSKQDINACIRKLDNTPSAANHLFVAARTFFRWAVKNDYVSVSPLAALSSPHRTTSRARVLTDDEVKSIWKATADRTPFHTIVRLLTLTGQRRGEIAQLQTSWIQNQSASSNISQHTSSWSASSLPYTPSHNLWTLTIPASVTKNGREHTIPISALSVQLLGSAVACDTSAPRNEPFFKARGSASRHFSGWSKSKTVLDKASGVTGWTLHDLRRTYASTHAKLGTPIHVIEKLLNHVTGSISGVAAIYNRHTYADEMRAAVDNYEAHLKKTLALK